MFYVIKVSGIMDLAQTYDAYCLLDSNYPFNMIISQRTATESDN